MPALVKGEHKDRPYGNIFDHSSVYIEYLDFRPLRRGDGEGPSSYAWVDAAFSYSSDKLSISSLTEMILSIR